MCKPISTSTLRDARQILLKPGLRSSVLYLDSVSVLALNMPLPTLAAITVTSSGLIIIGPDLVIRSCVDPGPAGFSIG